VTIPTFDQAAAELTGPGGKFELVDEVVDGRTVRVFRHAPPTLRLVFDSARGRGDDLYLVYEDDRWTFAEVMARVDALGAALVERYGVTKGDRVAIAMRNYPDWVVAYAATISIGAVAVLVNAWWTTDELAYGLDDSGAKVVVADAERVERVMTVRERLGVQVIGVRLGDDAPWGVDAVEDLYAAGGTMPAVELGPDDPATILYTSGTTGHPKGALSTHRAVVHGLLGYACRAAVDAMRQPPRTDSGDEATDGAPQVKYPTAFILTVPLFHVTGCIPVMLSTFAMGTKLVMMHKWNPERALELIERERVTQFVGVPTMSRDMLESPDWERRDTSSLKSISGGGAPAPPELVRRIGASVPKGSPGIGYGMTETNAYGPTNNGHDYLTHPTSAGKTVPMMQVRVVGPDGTPLGVNEVGEIEFAGPNLISGYWNRPEATAEAFHDGWLRTGDLGRIDEDGFVYVEDRLKDMVLRGGENIYCAEVEAVLHEHPAIYECAVFGVPDERLGEELACTVVLRPQHSLTEIELREHVGAHLASFKVPRHIDIRDNGQLPRGATGKIQKRDLRDALTTRLS
jgi:long-chain acyl-CoA synthetase